MKEWEVTLYETVKHSTTVEAESRQEAYDKAWNIIANGPSDGYETEAEGFTGEWDAYEV